MGTPHRYARLLPWLAAALFFATVARNMIVAPKIESPGEIRRLRYIEWLGQQNPDGRYATKQP